MNATPFLRKALVAVSWSGLGLIALAVVLSDFFARAAAGAARISGHCLIRLRRNFRSGPISSAAIS